MILSNFVLQSQQEEHLYSISSTGNGFEPDERELSISPHHREEWERSEIDPTLIDLNLISSESEDRIASWYFQNLGSQARRNDGRIRDGYLRAYANPLKGGWFGSGYDPTDWDKEPEERSFKPDRPRLDADNKPIKYDNPKNSPFQLYFPRISYLAGKTIVETALQERKLSDIPFEELCSQYGGGEDGEECRWFWGWVLREKRIPITIVEGYKKTLSLLSHGRVAIGVGSVTTWMKESGSRELHPWLVPFIEGGEVYICFDLDVKPKTVRAVNSQAFKMGHALKRVGARRVKRLAWKGSGKGIDDQLHLWQQGKYDPKTQLAHCYKSAESFERVGRQWRGKVIEVDLPKGEFSLNNLSPQDREAVLSAKLLLTIGDKGIGKTQLISEIIDLNINEGTPTLALAPLQSLAREASSRTGLPYRKPDFEGSESKQERKQIQNDSKEMRGLIGYTLCLDSANPINSVPLKPEAWENADLFFDEADVGFHHWATGQTEIKKVRGITTATLYQKIVDCYLNDRRIMLASADLTPIELKLMQDTLCIHGEIERAEIEANTVILINTHKMPRGKAYRYSDNKQWRAELAEEMKCNKKLMILSTSQQAKAKDGTIALEKLARRHGYNKSEIVRLDSETLDDPDNPFSGLSGKQMAALVKEKGIKIVIVSPSLVTGYDLSGLEGYFDSVWINTVGNLGIDLISQMMCRLRDFEASRHIYAPKTGLAWYGSRSVVPSELKAEAAQYQKNALNAIAYREAEAAIDAGTSPLENYKAEKGAALNSQMWRYAESLFAKLEDEGWEVIEKVTLAEIGAAISPLALQELAALNAGEKLDESIASKLNSLRDARNSLDAAIKEAWNTRNQIQKEAISERDRERLEVEAIDEVGAESLKAKTKRGESLTRTEKLQLENFNLCQQFGGIELSKGILEAERKRIFSALMLRFWATLGRSFVVKADRQNLTTARKINLGLAYLPNFAADAKTVKVQLFENKILSLDRFLQEGREWSNEDPELIEWADFIREKLLNSINAHYRAGISPKDKPIAIANKILRKIGLKLPFLRQARTGEKRTRMYGAAISAFTDFLPLDIEREIFARLQERTQKQSYTHDEDFFDLDPPSPPPLPWNPWDRVNVLGTPEELNKSNSTNKTSKKELGTPQE